MYPKILEDPRELIATLDKFERPTAAMREELMQIAEMFPGVNTGAQARGAGYAIRDGLGLIMDDPKTFRFGRFVILRALEMIAESIDYDDVADDLREAIDRAFVLQRARGMQMMATAAYGTRVNGC